MIQAFELVLKRWQNNIPEYLISPLTTGFRIISIGVVKDRTKPHFFGMLISSVKSVPSLVSGAGDLVGGAVAKGCGQVFCGVTCCMATAYIGHVACEGTGVGYQKGDDGTVKVFVDYRLRGAPEMWGQVKDDVQSVKAMITRQGDVEKVDSNPSDPQAEALSNSRSEGGEIEVEGKSETDKKTD